MIATIVAMPEPVPANMHAYFDIFACVFANSLAFVSSRVSSCSLYSLYLMCASFFCVVMVACFV